jgi:hypothetical protein
MRNQYTLGQYQPFFPSVTVALLAVIGNAANPLLILPDDSEFLLSGFEAWTSQDPTLVTDLWFGPPDNFTVYMQIQSTGKYLSLEPLHRSVICGTTRMHYVPEVIPVRFPRKTQLLITIANLTAVAMNVQFVLKGYKAFQSLPNTPSPGQ